MGWAAAAAVGGWKDGRRASLSSGTGPSVLTCSLTGAVAVPVRELTVAPGPRNSTLSSCRLSQDAACRPGEGLWEQHVPLDARGKALIGLAASGKCNPKEPPWLEPQAVPGETLGPGCWFTPGFTRGEVAGGPDPVGSVNEPPSQREPSPGRPRRPWEHQPAVPQTHPSQIALCSPQKHGGLFYGLKNH